ncbi:hypothetical protein N7520_008237 [Penicillium odoratum]|uniref:uncharacterized protein n=1 Tax=Penicillium odoratum TaxID=1167516 RepID=UPI002547D2A1|nr:uncharacterized protein N7520_008237 [Penicillium odoratum]KAJ5761081.1 hypothetical protein N7520_008237 [Penicillium odoratum]
MLGAKHLDTMQAMADLAVAYYDQGKYDKAEGIDRQLYSLRSEIFGSRHPETISLVSPNASQIASASDDGTAKIWDAATGRGVSTLTGPGDSRLKRFSDLVGYRDRSTLTGHKNRVRSVDWSPDSGQLASASDDKTVKIWNAATGQCVSKLTGHRGTVFSVVWSPDGGPS